MLYKVGKIDYSFCNCCCVARFAEKGVDYAAAAYKRLKIYIVVVLVLNLGIQLAITILDSRFINSLSASYAKESDLIDH